MKKIVLSSILAVILVSILGIGTLAEESFLADAHSKMGCESCHSTGEYGDVATEVCLKCHQSWEKLAEKTASLHINPHKSPHFGMDSCTMCHHGHAADQNVCTDCHTLE